MQIMECGTIKKKKGIVLPVSAPFHSSLMKEASEKMKDKIAKADFLKLKPNNFLF